MNTTICNLCYLCQSLVDIMGKKGIITIQPEKNAENICMYTTCSMTRQTIFHNNDQIRSDKSNS